MAILVPCQSPVPIVPTLVKLERVAMPATKASVATSVEVSLSNWVVAVVPLANAALIDQVPEDT